MRLHKISRLLIAPSALAIAGVYFLPLWAIYLFAPQYPEGLIMKIWVNQLSGDVDIINGLNHYIGMGKISEEMFPELRAIPWFIAGYILFGLAVAWVGRLRWLEWYVAAFVAGGVVAIWDFWRWEYSYGHNLDPMAALKVPGESFQPPLFGYKKLLNFEVWSLPDVGGWLVIGAAGVALAVLVWELVFHKRPKHHANHPENREDDAVFANVNHRGTSHPIETRHQKILVLCLAISLLFTACDPVPQPIRYGQDECAHCKMSIIEPRFAAEVLTQKNKAYKFDDITCLLAWLKTGQVAESEIAQYLVADYNEPEKWLDAPTAWYFQTPALHSPMGGNTAAFINRPSAAAAKLPLDALQLRWQDLKTTFDQGAAATRLLLVGWPVVYKQCRRYAALKRGRSLGTVYRNS